MSNFERSHGTQRKLFIYLLLHIKNDTSQLYQKLFIIDHITLLSTFLNVVGFWKFREKFRLTQWWEVLLKLELTSFGSTSPLYPLDKACRTLPLVRLICSKGKVVYLISGVPCSWICLLLLVVPNPYSSHRLILPVCHGIESYAILWCAVFMLYYYYLFLLITLIIRL